MKKLEILMDDIFNVKLIDLPEDTDLKTLELWDSLNHMIFITNIEREFEIELTTEEIIQMTTLKDVMNVLSKRVESI